MKTSRLVVLGVTLTVLCVSVGCKCKRPVTLNSIPVPEGWAEVSAQTAAGTDILLGVPGDWEEFPISGTLLVRRSPTAIDGFSTNINLSASPFEGDLQDYVDSSKQLISQHANLTAENPVRLGDRDAYQLIADWNQQPRHTTIQLLEVVGPEAIVATCSMAEGQLEATRDLCHQIFGTLSISAAAP